MAEEKVKIDDFEEIDGDEPLDWDSEIGDGDEQPERVVFEPGTYQFKVKKFEREIAKSSGNKMAVLTLEVTDGKKKAEIIDRLVLIKKVEWKIGSFFRSIGLKKHGEKMKMRWSKVEGLTGECELETEERTSKKGNTYSVNTVKKYNDPIEDFEW